jgi:putative peptide zinc metalloprotease protein
VALFLLPAPLWTRAEGVIWLPEQSRVLAASDGFIARLLVQDGSLVGQGDPLVQGEAPFLGTRVKLLASRLDELRAHLNEVQFTNLTQAEVVRKEMESVHADLARARELLDALTVYSPADGRFVVPNASDLPGRFVNRGDLIGYVVAPSALTVRVAVGQEDIGLVRERTHDVEVVLDSWDATPKPAVINREVPAATDRLPNAALGAAGGGKFYVDPQDPKGLRTINKVFQFDLAVREQQLVGYVGSRVQVRFDHGSEPLAYRWYRSLTQLLLSRFGV